MKNTYILYLLLGLVLGLSSCQIDEFVDPNNPGISVVNDPTIGEIQNLISGMESGMRNRIATYYDGVCVIGREYYRFSGSDPRFTSDLLGRGSSVLDDNTFYTTNPYFDRYRVVKNCNLLLEGLGNTSAALSADQIANLRGLTNTIRAYQLLLVLNQQFSNGIRIEVADPDNLGPFRSFTDALSDIAGILDGAATDLGAGSEANFSVSLSDGFAGFDTPATFLQFNRAIAARVAVYREDFAGALTILNSSFLDLAGNLNTGPAHFFSTAGGDVINPMFFAQDATGDQRIMHPSFFTDAEAGDTRVTGKTFQRTGGPVTVDDLTGEFDLFVYESNEDFIPIIRNEELVLIYAEANIQTGNFAEAVSALNTVRNAAGLADYSGVEDTPSLITEMLNQRRYSLLAEGHRWVDMRRYNRLDELPIDREGDDVFIEFPRPVAEAE